jgi:dTDP-4-amino-4,6-dideoxygalactose transaminase
LRHLEEWTEARRRNADHYRTLFGSIELERRLIPPMEPCGLRHVYNQFVIRLPDRDTAQGYLSSLGIPTEIYYPEPLHLQPAFSYVGYKNGDFPTAEAASAQVLALPIFPELTEHQQAAVVDAIAQFYRVD